MRDDEFDRLLAEVDDIIDRLNQGDVTLGEGEKLKQRAEDLLDRLEAVLDHEDGEAVVVELDDGEVVEDKLLF